MAISKANLWRFGCLGFFLLTGLWIGTFVKAFIDSGSCSYSDFGDAKSSDGKYEAVLVNQDCGATSGAGWVSMVTPSSKPDLERAPEIAPEPDTMMVDDIRWTGSRKLLITYVKNKYSPATEADKAKDTAGIRAESHSRWKDVQIELRLVP